LKSVPFAGCQYGLRAMHVTMHKTMHET
jgi:hypothetical protein